MTPETSQKKYEQTEKGKETLKKYKTSEKGKKAIYAGIKKYKQTAQGKASRLRCLLKRVGWTEERYTSLNYAQGGLCYLCGETNYMKGLNKRLGADHNHDSLESRGLLCQWCNVHLHWLEDDKISAQVALSYLQKSL